MLLRMSGQANGYSVELSNIGELEESAEVETDYGVPGGAELRAFALAVHTRRDLPEARARLISALGPDAVAAASGVVGAFESVNRVADATGTRLDDMMAASLKGPMAGLGIQRMEAGHED